MDTPFIEINRNEALTLASSGGKWLVVGIPGSGKTHFLSSLSNKGCSEIIDADVFGHLEGHGNDLVFSYNIEEITSHLSGVSSFVFACPPDCAVRLRSSLFTDVLFIDNDPNCCYKNRINRRVVNKEPAFPVKLQSVRDERNFAISMFRRKFAAFRIYTLRQRVVGNTGRAELTL